ncbi:MAG TPA: beta-galactosidase trimerization domain-containing protein [Spirochaetia bacterium]|nr:beta-galactosidase trimerization domain-containing protein [Spirochaetia bacterium]
MSKWWQETGWRQIQTNLREIDMEDMNAEVYVEQLKAFKASVVMINAAGIIASYPTELPFHFQSPFLKGDSLEKIISACHAAGIHVVARTDFSKIRRPIYEAHPEWAYVGPNGHIVDYNGDVHACINGGYQREYVTTILQELLTKLDFDGIFFNMGGYQVRDYSENYYGICQCDSCRTKFRERFNLNLPTVEDIGDPVFRKYMVFKRETSRETKHTIDSFIHKLRPELLIDRAYELGFGYIRQESNTAVNRPLPHWQYSATDNIKWMISSYPHMIASNTTVDFIDIFYRHVAISPFQQKIRLVESLANGGALDYYLIGRLDNHPDKSGYEGIKEIFHYHAANEGHYRNLTSKAAIALVNSQGEGNQSEFRGWFRFLVESHQLFDTPLAGVLGTIDLSRYKIVILPDSRYLSDDVAAKLDRFVENGGTLVASGRSSFFNQDFEERAQPALRSLAIERIEQIRTDMRPSYFEIQPEEKKQFPRFSVTDLAYIEPEYVYCTYSTGSKGYFKLIPPHKFGPPERCYWDTVVDKPGVVVTGRGKGKAVYLPWLPGALFHRQGYTNTLDLVADVLEQLAGSEPVGGNLSPQVQVTHFAKEDGSEELVHLVNHSGHFGTTWFPPVTMCDLEVEIATSRAAKEVTSLRTGAKLPFEPAGKGRIRIRVPKLELFEAIRIA